MTYRPLSDTPLLQVAIYIAPFTTEKREFYPVLHFLLCLIPSKPFPSPSSFLLPCSFASSFTSPFLVSSSSSSFASDFSSVILLFFRPSSFLFSPFLFCQLCLLVLRAAPIFFGQEASAGSHDCQTERRQIV